MMLILWKLSCIIFLTAALAGESVKWKKAHPPVASLHVNHTDLMYKRIDYLRQNARQSVLVHIHVPKACGTALSVALSSDCRCRKDIDPPNCSGCRQVKGSKGLQVPYSICRSNGWQLGIHSPLAAVHKVLSRLAPHSHYAENGIVPIFIIMLRSPFERFISEISRWGGNKGQAVDWSIVNRPSGGNGSVVFYTGANESFLRTAGQNETDDQLRARLNLYASLPEHFIFHNRQVKMLGGTFASFDMTFESSEQVGSRWRANKVTNISLILQRAVHSISSQPDVILGIDERFAETVCMLEILYGHLYRFKWDPTVHSHDRGNSIDLHARLQSQADKYPEVYSTWRRHNAAEEQLYAAAVRVFDVQFQAALALLNNATTAGVGGDPAQPAMRVPHCAQFTIPA